MTQLRRDRGSISNYFDALLSGIGHRGSSFSDVDAITHDERTNRFLFQEFKGPHEELNRGQQKLLMGLARREYIAVWCVRRRSDGQLDWCDVASRRLDIITESEYQARFERWWKNTPVVVSEYIPSPYALSTPALITADDINWGGQ